MKKFFKWTGIILLVILASGIIVCASMYAVGRYQVMHSSYASSEGETLSDNISYDNHSYQRKEGLITLLGLGVDIRQDDIDDNSTRSGQSDAVIMAVLDPRKHHLELISIPRDIMVDVVVNPSTGETQPMQLTLQYAYGDGGTQSCELVENVISSMFYNQPIQGYGAINMLALPKLNDAVQGVVVTMDDDYTALNPAFEKGVTLRLMGDMATDYVHCRDITVPASSYARNNRHHIYMKAYKEAATEACKRNWLLPIQLLKILRDNMTTNLTLPEMFYLAVQIMQCPLSDDNIHVIDVTITKQGNYEQYYIDTPSFQQMIVNIFYKESG